MARVYLLRHQIAGVLWQYPFGAAPTAAQVSAVQTWCDTKWPNHPKYREDDDTYKDVKPWLKLAVGDDGEEGLAVVGAEMPKLPKPGKASGQVANIADANAPKVSGKGTVTNPTK